jgi:NAD+ kinase
MPKPNRMHTVLASHKSGVDSPDRFVSRYEAPPPLSQRHLIQALRRVDIKEREGEEGQWDDVRSGSSAYRVEGQPHQIPSGRNSSSPSERPLLDQNRTVDSSEPSARDTIPHIPVVRPNDIVNGNGNGNRNGNGETKHARFRDGPTENPFVRRGKAKAFAFFGQVRTDL